MRKISLINPTEIDPQEFGLVITSEEKIDCKRLKEWMVLLRKSGTRKILLMPDEQIVEGLRGWAKVIILMNIAETLTGVIKVKEDEREQVGQMGWRSVEEPVFSDVKTEFPKVNDSQTKKWMGKLTKMTENGKCWLDPAACVVVKANKLLTSGVSTNLNGGQCQCIPFKWTELKLKQGERWRFCDAIHAERMAISQAAKEGISLAGATMYLTKFPCRECSKSLIAAGIKKVVFQEGSYGLADAEILEANGVKAEQAK